MKSSNTGRNALRNSYMSLSLLEKDIIGWSTVFSASFGLVGTICMFGLAYFQPNHFQSITGKMLFAKSCTDLIDSVIKIVGRQGPLHGVESVLCKSQAVLINYSNQASIFLDFCLGMMVFVVAKSSSMKSITQQKEFYLIAAAFIWPIPFCMIMLLVPTPMPLIADVSLWCWISSKYFEYQVGLWFGWLWAVFMFNIVAIFVVSRYLNSLKLKKKVNKKHYFIVRRMKIFLFAFVVTWLGSSLNRSSQFLLGYPVFVLSLMQAICSPARGFWNLCAFLWCIHKTPKPKKESRTEKLDRQPQTNKTNTAGALF
jgi:hypothetical protein